MDEPPQTSRPPHVDLILQQIDALPTLSPIAARVLRISGSSEAEISEIVAAIESDPALASRILAMCRRSDKGVANAVTSIERAVIMLGLDAVRSAMLSIQVFELLDDENAQPQPPDDNRVDRREVWLFSLAVACTAEMLAENDPDVETGEAFLCGLLHDLGKIAIDRIMPRSFASIARTAERTRSEFGEIARRVVGLDHRTIGKRLMEHWALPHVLQDCAWLSAYAPQHLPDIPHKRAVQIVIAAIGIVRNLHIGWSGDFRRLPDPRALMSECGLEPRDLDDLAGPLNERLAVRAAALGLMDENDPSLLLHAIAHANRELGRQSVLLQKRALQSDRAARALREVSSFLAGACRATTLPATIGLVAESIGRMLESTVPGVIWQYREDEPCQLFELNGRALTGMTPIDTPDAPGWSLSSVLSGGLLGAGSWIRSVLNDIADPLGADDLRVVVLDPGTGACAAVLARPHDPSRQTLDDDSLDALRSAWTAAIATSAQHDGARLLGERVAAANAALLEAQSALVESRADSRLAEVSAGAAHEMNNALTVISGQAQSLLHTEDLGLVAPAAKSIVRSADRLSELISALHFFAHPPEPRPRLSSIDQIVRTGIDEALTRMSAETARTRSARSDSGVIPVLEPGLPEVRIDPAHMSHVVTELVLNAIQSKPSSRVEVRVHADAETDRILLSVADDGVGMSEHAVSHAFDPFFSERPAGRRTGLGLSRAAKFVEMAGGTIAIESAVGVGTTVEVALPLPEAAPQARAA